MVPPQPGGNHGTVAEHGAAAMAVVDLNGLALVRRDPYRRGVQHGQVEQYNRACRTVQVDLAAPGELFLGIEYGTVAGLRRYGEAVRTFVDIGQVEHHLQITAPIGPVRRMRTVPVPDLLRIAVARVHVPQARFSEPTGPFEDGLYRADQGGMADQAVDFRR